MTLPTGHPRCGGFHSPVRPSHWIPPCTDCALRLQPVDHVWQKFIEPAAVHVDGAWRCDKHVEWEAAE